MSDPNVSSVITIKQKARFHAAAMLFYVVPFPKIKEKQSFFENLLRYWYVCAYIISGPGMKVASAVRASAMLLLPVVGN
jgi:hypothetical protein